MIFRDYKNFRKGQTYHVYNRGNHKQNIFLEKVDYINFLKRCRLALGYEDPAKTQLNIRPLPTDSFDIIAFCLMPNHFHFQIAVEGNIGIDRFISKVCTSYVSYYNKKYDLIGNLFQDAFKSKEIDDDEYFIHLSAYIHNNPENPFNYPYSSLTEILNDNPPTLCAKKTILNWFNGSKKEYLNFVRMCQVDKYHKLLTENFDFPEN